MRTRCRSTDDTYTQNNIHHYKFQHFYLVIFWNIFLILPLFTTLLQSTIKFHLEQQPLDLVSIINSAHSTQPKWFFEIEDKIKSLWEKWKKNPSLLSYSITIDLISYLPVLAHSVPATLISLHSLPGILSLSNSFLSLFISLLKGYLLSEAILDDYPI